MNNQNVKISFIPKEPLLRGDVIVRKRPIMGLSLLIGLVIFATAFIVAGGVYYYKTVQYDNLIEKQEQLKEINDKLEVSDVMQSIEDIRILRDQIDYVTTILRRHVAMSSLFAFIEETTVSSVSFGSFDLDITNENEVQIKMIGQSRNYTDLAIQSSVYTSHSDVLKSFTLEGFKLTSAGTVEFTFTGVLNMDTLYYSYIVESIIINEMLLEEDISQDILYEDR